MSYETLDAIADAYNPTVFVLYLIFSVIYWMRNDKTAWIRGLLGIVVCYLLMAIDGFLGIWKMAGMDYSTHTAMALALIVFHVHKRECKSIGAIAFQVSLFSYLLLMHYQQYHTTADMVTTIIVVGSALLPIYLFRRKNMTRGFKSEVHHLTK